MDLIDHLDCLIPHLKLLSKNELAEPFFDTMSGGFVWSDEKIKGLEKYEMGCLRAIFRYRTSIIIGEPDQRFEEIWEKLKVGLPEWIGFDPERCSPRSDLIEEYFKVSKIL